MDETNTKNLFQKRENHNQPPTGVGKESTDRGGYAGEKRGEPQIWLGRKTDAVRHSEKALSLVYGNKPGSQCTGPEPLKSRWGKKTNLTQDT